MNTRPHHRTSPTKLDNTGSDTAQQLTTALDILRTYGWTQGQYGNKTIGFCMYGALVAAKNGLDAAALTFVTHHGVSDTVSILQKALIDLYPDSGSHISFFNDAFHREFGDIEKVFLHAIDIAAV